MKAPCETCVGGVEISASRIWRLISARVMNCGLSIPSPHGPHLARSGGGYRHGMVNQTNANRPDELFTTEPDQA
jgi:hypothetical protein